MNFAKTLATGLITATLLACSSNSNNNDPNPTDTVNDVLTEQGGANNQSDSVTQNGTVDTSAIAGLWDFTENEGDDGIDVIYVLIGSDGSGTIYDYLGDTYDQGDNCYDIIDSPVRTLGNNQYESIFSSFSATRDGENLVFTDSEGTAIVSPVVGLSVTDFNACV